MRVVVAMSGGVDSSVAAALLARGGPRRDRPVDAALRPARRRRPRVRHLLHASTTSTTRGGSPARIGIPHYIVNFERQFDEHGRRRTSCASTPRGRTPIPCVHCNGDLKFATLVERAEGFDAELRRHRPLRAGRARRGDRPLPAEARRRSQQGSVVLPVHADAGAARARACSRSAPRQGRGARARARARPAGRRQAGQPGDLLRRRRRPRGVRRARTAPAVAARRDPRRSTAACVGRHDGVHRFTVGQRKGLGLSSGIPLYVVGIDAGDGSGHGRPARGARARRR